MCCLYTPVLSLARQSLVREPLNQIFGEMASNSRFGCQDQSDIERMIKSATPANTVRTKQSVWHQFEQFCKVRKYELGRNKTKTELASILQDWAVNMRKANGEEYKEYSVKTIWNITAKILQEKYHNEFNFTFNPFSDIDFKMARDARNAKRKDLQLQPSKRKESSVALEEKEYDEVIDINREEEPEGLQIKFFHIASYELAWRGGERTNCLRYPLFQRRNWE